MGTLILSCNTGEGHNSCAKAIEEYYESTGTYCVTKDGLEFISPKVSHFISWGHSYVYRHLPWLFKFGYAYTEKHPAVFHSGSGIYRFMTQGAEKMFRYISEGKYDTVICTHVFTALMLTDMLKKHPMKLRTCFVSTDYTCSPSTKDSNLDYYFIPGDEFAPDFECETITEGKMIPSGIPVKQMFYKHCSSKEAKVKVGVAPEHKHLLMMCGSMGCGPMKKLLHKLSVQIPENWEISVICGNNQKLKKRLAKKYGSRQNIHIRGFVKDMGTMMDSAELYLTKPGGISVTEAAVKGLPMVFIDAVAGCEEYNRIYFIRKGGAKTGGTVDEVAKVCLKLMSDKEKRQRMQEKLSEAEQVNAAQFIYEKMKNLTENNDDTSC